MAGHGKHNPGRKTLLAISVAGGECVRTAAKMCGVGERTAHTWLKDPAFQTRVNSLRERMTDEAFGKITSAQTKAVEKLDTLLGSPNDSVALGAAKAILDVRSKMRADLDLAKKVAELEELVTRLINHAASQQGNETDRFPSTAGESPGPCGEGAPAQGDANQ